MAALERWRRFGLALTVVAATAGTGACASSAQKKSAARQPLPPQMVVPPTSDEAPVPVESIDERAGGATAAPSEPSPTPTLIVIDPADSAVDRQPSLAETATRERARRDREPTPVLVITNQNLAQHAAGGVLTIAHAAEGEESASDAEAEAIVARAAADEKLWRERGLEIRKRWREAADRVPELESKVAELRQRFYSTDDPVVRDGQVKPQWDRALADLEEARFQAARGAEEVADFLEAGRRAGALPGWLREGTELEPEPVVLDLETPVDHEPREPEIYEPPPGR